MDQTTIVNILWSLVGSIGVGLIALLGWWVRRLISTVSQNNIAVAVLTVEVKNLKEEFRHFRNVYQDPSF